VIIVRPAICEVSILLPPTSWREVMFATEAVRTQGFEWSDAERWVEFGYCNFCKTGKAESISEAGEQQEAMAIPHGAGRWMDYGVFGFPQSSVFLSSSGHVEQNR